MVVSFGLLEDFFIFSRGFIEKAERNFHRLGHDVNNPDATFAKLNTDLNYSINNNNL